MSVYRDNARWGALVSEHRAATASWFGAGVMGLVFGAIAIAWIPSMKHPDPKLYLGAVVLPVLGVWMFVEGARLRRVVLRIFERGLAFSDQRGLYEVEWRDIAALEDQIARGKLLAITVRTPTASFALPKELHGFTQLRALLEKKTTARWTRVDVGSLIGRRG